MPAAPRIYTRRGLGVLGASSDVGPYTAKGSFGTRVTHPSLGRRSATADLTFRSVLSHTKKESLLGIILKATLVQCT